MKFGYFFLFILALACGFAPFAVAAEEKPKDVRIFRAAMDKDGVQRVEVVGGGYFFDPNHIIVKVNLPVELKVRKEPGVVPHDIVMNSPEAGMDFRVSMHEEPQIIRFTPNKTGVYPFYCSKKLLFFESHREKGMEGVLEVVEQH
jgi:plastocyanin domain-containing protein